MQSRDTFKPVWPKFVNSTYLSCDASTRLVRGALHRPLLELVSHELDAMAASFRRPGKTSFNPDRCLGHAKLKERSTLDILEVAAVGDCAEGVDRKLRCEVRRYWITHVIRLPRDLHPFCESPHSQD